MSEGIEPACKYLVKSDEAWRIEGGEFRRRIDVHMCEWPDQHPDRFTDAPLWLLKLVGPSHSVNPEFDCVNCPARLNQKGNTDG